MLFVCGQNRLRSPTAEQVFADWPGIEVDSAGLKPESDTPLTPEALSWAELIFVMEKAQRRKLEQRFRPHLGGKRIICLDIADRYSFMEPALVELLLARVSRHLPAR
ncbi:low molecular weight protein tyrosine phosphatase family protein [Rivibacter subsaxonicus]|uniref:low molecular weight protein tyrosine phosphatase family protein n=1 Tax=Rivibacter subsaxonicus TaxID=457575 RepID=UPI001F5FE02F|nr:low molecular weight protein tyrosine phosphatase family protein [Rivibacter subsaxonicus]